jgi:hypothetical protein
VLLGASLADEQIAGVTMAPARPRQAIAAFGAVQERLGHFARPSASICNSLASSRAVGDPEPLRKPLGAFLACGGHF